ncbi:MAG: PAAR domain-containing protein [Rhizobiales bacterium]|nr:PAAR domain-containing protein [Hyphomicrobiales bacterium]
MRALFVLLSFFVAHFAHAQGAPSVVNQGAADVSVGGHSAARQGDTTSNGGVIVEGSSNVMINGKPAAIAGGRTDCGGVVTGNANGVFINGKPMVTNGDLASGCANK